GNTVQAISQSSDTISQTLANSCTYGSIARASELKSEATCPGLEASRDGGHGGRMPPLVGGLGGDSPPSKGKGCAAPFQNKQKGAKFICFKKIIQL
ncbi:MAG: hypothetical protein EZS28_049792, partial [Streblomastix strix]